MASDDKPANGEHGVEHQVVDTVILAYNPATDILEIGGKCNSLDRMLDMLARATRAIDQKWKLEQLNQVRREMMDAARTAEILRQVAASKRGS